MRQVGEIHNDCSSHLYLKQQLFGGSGLETLTEVENEDEFSKGSSPSTDTDSYTNCGSGSSNGTSSGDEIVVPRSRASSHRSCENILLLEDDGCTADVDCDDEDEDREERRIGRMKYFGHSSLPSSLNTISNLTAASHDTLHYHVNDTVTSCQSCAKILRLKKAKTFDLEKTIQQLKDELKECRDQNELLEFRLLEIQEFGVTPNDEFGRVGNGSKPVEELIETNDQVGVRRNNSNRKGLEYGPEVTSEEVMIQSEYQNNHASVSESRSSCSDCSESLSFQESGIFDSQFSEESCPPPNSSSSTSRESVVSDASTELAILSFQIENLILRLNNPPHTNINNEIGASNDKCDETTTSRKVGKNRSVSAVSGGSRMKGKDLKDSGICLELQSCRKQVQELEKRITPYLNNTYIKTLQDKISVLDHENRRLEEERCEMEEAENDSRNQCQRLDEMLRQLRDRNIVLQREISREKAFVEQLSFQMEEVQENHSHAISQLNRLDCLVQNYEQRNFELEESNIELKTSTKFLVEFWPLFELARYLWSLWRSNEGAASDQQNLGHIQKRNLVTLVQSRQFAKSSLFGPAAPRRRRKLPKLPSSSTTSITHPTKVTSQQNEISSFVRNSCSQSTQTVEQPTREDGKSDGVMITLIEQSNKQFNDRNNVLASMRERSESQEREQEQNINEYRKVSEMEKIEIIEKYERKLADTKQESNDKSEHSRRELANLRESWHGLIKELEQACSSLNLTAANKPAASTAQIPDKTLFDNNALRKSTTPISSTGSEVESVKSATLGTKITATNKIKGGSLVANRIQALFPNELRVETRNCGTENNFAKDDSISYKPAIKQKPNVSLINKNSAEGLSRKLVCYFKELKEKFESRESALLNQIDQLKQQKISEQDSIKLKHPVRDVECIHPTEQREESRRIVQLLEEKSRLESILSDQEKVWSKLKDAEEENERLATELNSTIAMLKRKLDDSMCIEKDLQIRIEELEMSECSSKDQLSKRDAKIWKLSQEIKRLKEDCEFYHNKSCQLQSDLDDRMEEVMKFKNEVQQLSTKLKTHEQMLQDKEHAFEATETTLETQISQLQAHLKSLQQELCDSECTSGMLREEVSYLERTLQAALEKNSQSEDEMKILTCRMQEKVESLDELRRECCCSAMKDGQGQVMGAINDLDVFAKNEGGLVGMTRDIEEIQQVVQRCSQCSDAGKMLTEVSQQLNTLTLMLGGSQAGTCVFMSPEEQNFLTRCESDENITTCSATGAGDPQQDFAKEMNSCHSVIEENKMLHTHLVQLSTELNAKDQEIERLQRSISSLGIELSELEKEFLARKNDLKESHLNELIWWKLRCQEKNDLIHLLARRIAHLSVSDTYGYFMDGILKEIQQIRDENYSTKQHRMKSKSEDEASPQDCNSLLTFFNNERRSLTEMLNSCADADKHPSSSKSNSISPAQAVDFRVLRRLSEDSILVSWTIPDNVSTGLVDGYEISVNGNIFLRIPKPNRFKAVLFGLDMSEPLELCLRCTGAYKATHESCITFIA